MDLRDDYWGIDKDLVNGFYMEKLNTRNLPYKNNFQNSVTYEMSL